MTETKPAGLSPFESWAWENAEPGSWQRRGLAWSRERANAREEEERPRSGGWERAAHRAVLPGRHGLECVFYQYLQYKTMHLRREVYVTFATEGGEFRPGDGEHIPHGELIRYQQENILTVGEQSYGQGRVLEVVFACYSPEGSGAAGEAVLAIRDALEDLRDVAKLPDWERSKFGFRHGMKAALIKMRDQAACYRPPLGALPYRAGPPRQPLAPGQSFSERVDALMRKWGHGDIADERKAERRRSVQRRAGPPEAADAFGFGGWSPKSEWEREMERTEREMRRLEKQQRELERGYGWTF